MDLKTKRTSLLREAFGALLLEKDGVNVSLKCPKCAKPNSSKKKLVVRLDDGKFHCWVCGLKGTNIGYLFGKYKPSLVEKCKSLFHTKTSFKSDLEPEDETKDLSCDLEGFTLLGDSIDSRDPDTRAVFNYTRSRGVSLEKMWRYRLGTVRSGRLRRRLIIPSFDSEGNLNYYCAREIGGTSRMKYINAPVPKVDIIFNEFMIDWSKPVTLVEGPMDVIEAGSNAVCLLGSHLAYKSSVAQKLIKNGTDVYIALDSDAKDKAEKIASLLMSHGNRVMIVDMPPEKDISDIGERTFLEIKEKTSEWNDQQRLLGLISRIKSGSII